jgi:hypothetical protein
MAAPYSRTQKDSVTFIGSAIKDQPFYPVKLLSPQFLAKELDN